MRHAILVTLLAVPFALTSAACGSEPSTQAASERPDQPPPPPPVVDVTPPNVVPDLPRMVPPRPIPGPTCATTDAATPLRQIATGVTWAELGPCGEVAYMDGSRQVWLLPRGPGAAVLLGTSPTTYASAFFTPDGTALLYTLDSTATARDLATGAERPIVAPLAGIIAVSHLSSGANVVSICNGAGLSLLDVGTAALTTLRTTPCQSIDASPFAGRAVAHLGAQFSPPTEVLVIDLAAKTTVALDGSVSWDRAALASSPSDSAREDVAISPDGAVLIRQVTTDRPSGDTYEVTSRNVHLYDLATAKRFASVEARIGGYGSTATAFRGSAGGFGSAIVVELPTGFAFFDEVHARHDHAGNAVHLFLDQKTAIVTDEHTIQERDLVTGAVRVASDKYWPASLGSASVAVSEDDATVAFSATEPQPAGIKNGGYWGLRAFTAGGEDRFLHAALQPIEPIAVGDGGEVVAIGPLSDEPVSTLSSDPAKLQAAWGTAVVGLDGKLHLSSKSTERLRGVRVSKTEALLTRGVPNAQGNGTVEGIAAVSLTTGAERVLVRGARPELALDAARTRALVLAESTSGERALWAGGLAP